MKIRGNGRNTMTAINAPTPVQNPAKPAIFPLMGFAFISEEEEGVICGRMAVTMATQAEPPSEKKRRRKSRSGYTFDGWTKANNEAPMRR